MPEQLNLRRAGDALVRDDVPYRPFDQERKLGPPPWKSSAPEVQAWEVAHGHDARLKCYPELGCSLVVPGLEAEVERLRAIATAHPFAVSRERFDAAERAARDALASNSELRAEVVRLRAALTPFALLAQHVDQLRHADDSTAQWRLRAADIRAARDALTHPAERINGGDHT